MKTPGVVRAPFPLSASIWRAQVAGNVPALTLDWTNRQELDGGTTTGVYAVNNLNQYTTVAGAGATYDSNGNLEATPGGAIRTTR